MKLSVLALVYFSITEITLKCRKSKLYFIPFKETLGSNQFWLTKTGLLLF